MIQLHINFKAMTWCIFANLKLFHSGKSGSLDLHCKWFKFKKGMNYEHMISQVRPYNLLLNVSNESFIEKVKSAT